MNAATTRFGRFVLDVAQRRLLADGEAVTLGSRAFEVLQILVEQRPRVVAKAELLDLVWPGLVVEENNLQVQISALRKVLGPAAIATLPGRGYRFAMVADDAATLVAAPAALQETTTDGAPGNVPVAVKTLVGREAELRELNARIESHRLVTVVGPAGMGKTSLAMATADALRQRWPDGAWVVELAALSDPGAVARLVTEALRVACGDGDHVADRLAGYLHARHLLLVLDNCEHLLDAVAHLVATVLRRAPGVHVLATSQQHLNVAGETVFALDPLSLPPPAAAPHEAVRHGSVRLFVERAQAADVRFALSADNVNAVGDVCRRLDGLPLAIELAAARVRSLGIHVLRERLDERFRVLTGGARTSLPRHRALHTALDWSHGLLAPPEQAIFRRLGVFSGGFTLELAQRVASDTTLDDWAVLDGLSSLVDKSMVVASAGDPPRYALLETARVYALERLAQAHETAAVSRRHAEALCAMFVQARRERFGECGELSGDAYVACLQPEFENVRAALLFATGPGGDDRLAVALTAAAVEALDPAGHGAEGLARLQSLRPRAEALEDAETATCFWAIFARVAGERLADDEDFERIVDRAKQGCRRLAWSRMLFRTLVAEAWRRIRLVDLDAARLALAEAATLEQPDWPAWFISDRLNAEGGLLLNTGDLLQTRERMFAAGQVLPASGESQRRIRVSINLAVSAALRANWEESAGLLLPVMESARREHHHTSYTAWASGQLVLSLTQLGRLDEARELLLDQLPLWRADGILHLRLFIAIRLAVAQSRAADAMRLTGAEERLAHRLASREPLAARIRAESRQLIDAALPDSTERERLRREGAALDESAVAALCLAEPVGPSTTA